MTVHFDPASALDGEIRRLAMPEIEKAIAELASAHVDPHKAVHRVRKQLKWIRALFALVRPADDGFFGAENRRYRDIARSLARPRTAAACVEAIDRFCQDYPRQCERNNVEPAARPDGGAHHAATKRWKVSMPPSMRLLASCEAGLAALDRFRTASGRDDDAEVLRLCRRQEFEAHRALARRRRASTAGRMIFTNCARR